MGLLNLDARGKRVLIIPDEHRPYHHPDSYKFLTEIKRQFKPEKVIHLGDEVDGHAISFHDSDNDLMSAGQELEAAIESIQREIHPLFKHLYLLESNHGSLIYRKAKHHGIPIHHLKSLSEVYETPMWSWHTEIMLKTKLGQVYLCHGKSSVPFKVAMSMGCSSIQGHFHSEFRIMWRQFADNRRIFDCISGCLIDPKHDAFAYGKNILPKPMLGATIVHANGIPETVPML